jgi:hypothetical protein
LEGILGEEEEGVERRGRAYSLQSLLVKFHKIIKSLELRFQLVRDS